MSYAGAELAENDGNAGSRPGRGFGWETLPLADLFCLRNKFVLWNLLGRNLKLKYRRSVFGYLWTLLIPLAQVLIFFFVYKVILKIEVSNYLSFIVSGLLPWVFFVSSINESLESLVGNHQLLMHAPIPIQVFPASINYTNFINLMPSLPIIFVVYAVEARSLPGLYSLLIFPLCAILFLFTYSLSFLLACLYVYLRDLKHLISIAIQLWLYITPVLYRVELVPPEYSFVISWNPLAGFFIALRQCLFENRLPDVTPLSLFILWTLGTLVIAEYARRRLGGFIVEKI